MCPKFAGFGHVAGVAKAEAAKFYLSSCGAVRCPNDKCVHAVGGSGFCIKKGYFKTKWNGQPVPRYQCRGCGKHFSSHTLRASVGHHRPDLNDPVFQFYSSGMTQRRMAKCLSTDRKTIARKVLFAARLARKEHEHRIATGQLKTTHAQFDEMESFEHTRMKPIAVALGVRAKTGEIIGIRCSQMAYKGPLAAQGFRKYGPRPDQAAHGIERILSAINRCAGEELTLTTDANPKYLNQVKAILPQAEHRPVKCAYEKTDRANQKDPMFTLSYVAAKIRSDLSRMRRMTWVTTKKIEWLQVHMDLYIAYNNRYQIAA